MLLTRFADVEVKYRTIEVPEACPGLSTDGIPWGPTGLFVAQRPKMLVRAFQRL